MSFCLHMPCNRPEWLDLSEKKNIVYSVLAGLLFSVGWWIIIDVAARHPSNDVFNHAFHTCGVISTISLFMVNIVSNAQVRGEVSYTDGFCGQTGARAWLFVGFVLGFASLIVGIYVLIDTRFTGISIALFLQNALIFGGSMALKFGRKEDDSWST